PGWLTERRWPIERRWPSWNSRWCPCGHNQLEFERRARRPHVALEGGHRRVLLRGAVAVEVAHAVEVPRCGGQTLGVGGEDRAAAGREVGGRRAGEGREHLAFGKPARDRAEQLGDRGGEVTGRGRALGILPHLGR